jgi:flagellar hook-length control protein FliK
METTAISLLTVGMPITDVKSSANLTIDTKLAEPVNDLTAVDQVFATLLASADLRLQMLGLQKVVAHNDSKEDRELSDKGLLEKDFLKRISEELGEHIIAGIMPAATLQTDHNPQWHESSVAGIIFTPSLAAPTLSENEALTLAASQDMPRFDVLDVVITRDEKLNEDIPNILPDAVTKSTDALFLMESKIAPTTSTPLSTASQILIAADTSTELVVAQAAPILLPQRSLTHPITKALPSGVEKEASTMGNDAAQFSAEGIAIKKAAQVDAVNEEAAFKRTLVSEMMGETQTVLPTEGGAKKENAPLISHENASRNFVPHHLNETSLLKFSTDHKPLTQMNPTEQVSIHIAQAKIGKMDRVTLNLHPTDLGRVEIRMQVDSDQNTFVRIHSESRDTYDLLRADRGNLERILQDVGLKLDSGNLEFGYRGENQASDTQDNQGFANNSDDGSAQTNTQEMTDREVMEAALSQQHLSIAVTTGVNIRV